MCARKRFIKLAHMFQDMFMSSICDNVSSEINVNIQF